MKKSVRAPARAFAGRTEPLRHAVALAIATAVASPAIAQNDPLTRGSVEEVVVTGRRVERAVSSIPNSVSVIDTEELNDQFTLDDNLNSMLQFSVPGIAGQSTTIQSRATLRGRTALILVDGVPQNQLLRSSGFDIRTIGADAIERVEVIRGANAVFGFGATGGVINFITRRPVEEGFEVSARARTTFQTSEADPSRELYVSGSGRVGPVGLLLGVSSDDMGVAYDGDGNLLPNANTEFGKDILNVHGALEWEISDVQRVRATGNFYRREDVLGDYTIIDEPGDPATGRFSTARFADAFYTDYDAIYYGTDEVDPSTLPFELLSGYQEFTNATLAYQHDDLLGSSVDVTALYHYYPLRFPYFRFLGLDVAQERERERIGLRASVDTPLDGLTFMPRGSRLVWGADYIINSVDERGIIGNPDGTVTEGTRTTVRTSPYIEQASSGVFTQLEAPVGDFLFTGGVRYEYYDIDMADAEFDFGGTFEGGNITYDATVFNAGIVYYVNDDLDVYASFSQGLDVTQVGRAAFQVESAEQIDPQAAVTDAWEVGARSRIGRASVQLAAFYSDSELASRTQSVAGGSIAIPLRQPEQIWGVEAAFTYTVNGQLELGGNFTWNDGERELEDGTSEQLQTIFLSPTTINTYANWAPRPWLSARLQLQHFFGTDDFDEATSGFGRGDYEDLTLVDAFVSFDSERFGQLDIGIDNLFNVVEVAPGDRATNVSTSFFPMPGRTLALSYTYRFRGR